MGREWKIGDWCELNGRRYFVYRTMVDRCWAVPHDGSGQDIMFDRGDEDVKHLPACTGWDWQPPKPIEPPPGYRLLERVEIESGTIQSTDLFWISSGTWAETNSTGTAVRETGRVYARKIEPKYRQFLSAEEFKPHRDRWVIDDDGDQIRIEQIRKDGRGIKTIYGSISFKDAFVRYKFDDGSPFGVLETEPQPAASV